MRFICMEMHGLWDRLCGMSRECCVRPPFSLLRRARCGAAGKPGSQALSLGPATSIQEHGRTSKNIEYLNSWTLIRLITRQNAISIAASPSSSEKHQQTGKHIWYHFISSDHARTACKMPRQGRPTSALEVTSCNLTPCSSRGVTSNASICALANVWFDFFFVDIRCINKLCPFDVQNMYSVQTQRSSKVMS
jgi:hypothetical protein